MVVSAKHGDMSIAVQWETGVVPDDEAVEMTTWLEGELKGLAEP